MRKQKHKKIVGLIIDQLLEETLNEKYQANFRGQRFLGSWLSW